MHPRGIIRDRGKSRRKSTLEMDARGKGPQPSRMDLLRRWSGVGPRAGQDFSTAARNSGPSRMHRLRHHGSGIDDGGFADHDARTEG